MSRHSPSRRRTLARLGRFRRRRRSPLHLPATAAPPILCAAPCLPTPAAYRAAPGTPSRSCVAAIASGDADFLSEDDDDMAGRLLRGGGGTREEVVRGHREARASPWTRRPRAAGARPQRRSPPPRDAAQWRHRARRLGGLARRGGERVTHGRRNGVRLFVASPFVHAQRMDVNDWIDPGQTDWYGYFGHWMWVRPVRRANHQRLVSSGKKKRANKSDSSKVKRGKKKSNPPLTRAPLSLLPQVQVQQEELGEGGGEQGAEEMENGGSKGDVPEDANAHCPGTESEEAGKADSCAGCPNQQICATAPKGPDPDLVAIAERMANVKHKILVLSGKGGVGKSTFSAQLSFSLAERDHQVGLLDIDICGPSIPKMLGLEGQDIHQSNLGWSPIYVESNLGVMSIGFMLPNPDDAVIWRGPRKNGLIKQFLKDVDWGEIDYLVVDAPPGTSDEHISIVQYLQATGVDGAIIVTTPQQVSLIDVRKEINFCKKVGVPVLGVVENMSGLRQAFSDLRFMKPGATGETDATEWAMNYIKENAPELLSVVACSEVFDSSKGGAEKMCQEMGVPFLGKVPMDPQLCKAAEEGRSCFVDQRCSASAPALKSIIDKLIKTNGDGV